MLSRKKTRKAQKNTKDKPITAIPARKPVKKQEVGLNKSEDKLVSKPRPTQRNIRPTYKRAVKTTAEKNKANASLTTTEAGRQKAVIRKPIWFGHQAESGELACFALCRLTFFQLCQNT
jgi:FKBP-type peptidyl-prolyl cis-trans isomerase